MPDKEPGATIGIPQVIKTPGRFFNMARYIREEIIGKPTPEKYDDYEDFVEALVDWVLEHPSPQQAATAKPLLDNFETYESFLETLIDWKISEPHNLTRRTDTAFNKALASQDPDDWKALQQILGECLQPVAFNVPELDGSGTTRTWLFERTDNGLVGHRTDGSASLFWSEESGILSWGREQIPAII